MRVRSGEEIAWEQKMLEVNEITDRLGKGVDEKIKGSVAAFLIHKFTTNGFCEGHMNEEGEDRHGLPYPWIEVYAPEPEGWKESEEEKREWTVNNFRQQQRMMEFLEEFYKGRETPFDAQLAFDGIGVFGGFRVQSFGAKMTAILTPEEKKQKLELYQKEMGDFSKFLKDRHFSKK